jgi:KDO2-lipid IV(A) lauroyltransferase
MPPPRPPLTKDLKWRVEAAGFDLFTGLVRLLPVDVASALGGAAFKAFGPLSGAHRTAQRGLRLAFPSMPDIDRGEILAAQWENFGRYVFEFPHVDRLTPASGRVGIVHPERLTAIAGSGRPVVLISGHFANLEIMAAVIVAAGIQCEISYRAANNPYVDSRIIRSRESYGVRLFARKGRDGARDLMRAMGAGRSIAILNDQRYDAGVPTPFFGRTVMTNPAAARMALKFGAVVQPLSIQRLSGARFRCVAHEPIVPARSGDRIADVQTTMNEITAFIEDRVRENPGAWWWVHRRWPRADYQALKDKGL